VGVIPFNQRTMPRVLSIRTVGIFLKVRGGVPVWVWDHRRRDSQASSFYRGSLWSETSTFGTGLLFAEWLRGAIAYATETRMELARLS